MGFMSVPAELRSTGTPPGRAQTTVRGGTYRATLVLAVLATAALVAVPTLLLVPAPAMAPDLLRLLRGMVLIKGLIALAAGVLVWWRLGRPIERGLALRYVAALCLSAGALAWLWGLHLVLLGSLCFYAGLAGLVLFARRDPLLSALPVTGRARRDKPRTDET